MRLREDFRDDDERIALFFAVVIIAEDDFSSSWGRSSVEVEVLVVVVVLVAGCDSLTSRTQSGLLNTDWKLLTSLSSLVASFFVLEFWEFTLAVATVASSASVFWSVKLS